MAEHISTAGARVGYFSVFVDTCGGKEVLEGKPTSELRGTVCEAFIKPATARAGGGSSLWELLRADEITAGYVALSAGFISHAWSYPFFDMPSKIRLFLTKSSERTLIKPRSGSMPSPMHSAPNDTSTGGPHSSRTPSAPSATCSRLMLPWHLLTHGASLRPTHGASRSCLKDGWQGQRIKALQGAVKTLSASTWGSLVWREASLDSTTGFPRSFSNGC